MMVVTCYSMQCHTFICTGRVHKYTLWMPFSAIDVKEQIKRWELGLAVGTLAYRNLLSG